MRMWIALVGLAIAAATACGGSNDGKPGAGATGGTGGAPVATGGTTASGGATTDGTSATGGVGINYDSSCPDTVSAGPGDSYYFEVPTPGCCLPEGICGRAWDGTAFNIFGCYPYTGGLILWVSDPPPRQLCGNHDSGIDGAVDASTDANPDAADSSTPTGGECPLPFARPVGVLVALRPLRTRAAYL